ncbi:MAG: hypothetical protein KAS32_29215, partial [Candidatus Peribacteraceae bacterium]|nr:hypothetical protein [Candidatus Peribacteraceae bacterium]
MDERFKNTPVFQRRRIEWDKEKVKAHIERLFRSVEIIDGWNFISCEWTTGQKTKRSEELKRHILSVLKIKVKDASEKEYSYDIQIPELIEDQFFYIGGYLKVPIFQLFDHPIIHRNGVVRLRTNTLTATLDLNRNDNALKLKLFNRDVPIEFFITAAYEKEDLDTFMETHQNECLPLSTIVERCERRWEETTQEQRINELGKYFSTVNTDKTKKGLGAVFSLKAAYEVDFFSQEFFETDSILFEILHAIYSGIKSDTDFENKRIRFEEYILAPLIKKIYDMMLTIYNSKKVKFQITQSVIIDNCNVSDIVHFNFPINPVSEIASLLQATLTGPGGFKKDNVPAHLRDLDDSQFGYVCPADTPDRDGCG